jgi:hypothetical protein
LNTKSFLDKKALSLYTKEILPAHRVVETDYQPTIVAGRGRSGAGAELEQRKQGRNPKNLAVFVISIDLKAL